MATSSSHDSDKLNCDYTFSAKQPTQNNINITSTTSSPNCNFENKLYSQEINRCNQLQTALILDQASDKRLDTRIIMDDLKQNQELLNKLPPVQLDNIQTELISKLSGALTFQSAGNDAVFGTIDPEEKKHYMQSIQQLSHIVNIIFMKLLKLSLVIKAIINKAVDSNDNFDFKTVVSSTISSVSGIDINSKPKITYAVLQLFPAIVNGLARQLKAIIDSEIPIWHMEFENTWDLLKSRDDNTDNIDVLQITMSKADKWEKLMFNKMEHQVELIHKYLFDLSTKQKNVAQNTDDDVKLLKYAKKHIVKYWINKTEQHKTKQKYIDIDKYGMIDID